MATALPLTVETYNSQNNHYIDNGYDIILGTNKYTSLSAQTLTNVYWCLVVDRTTLAAVQNFTFTDNASIPSQLNSYINNSQYLLIINTLNTYTTHLPTGNLFQFFKEMGAGRALDSLEQIYSTLNCGGRFYFAYVLIAAMDGSFCFDYGFQNDADSITLQLQPVDIPGGGVLYTPVLLQ